MPGCAPAQVGAGVPDASGSVGCIVPGVDSAECMAPEWYMLARP